MTVVTKKCREDVVKLLGGRFDLSGEFDSEEHPAFDELVHLHSYARGVAARGDSISDWAPTDTWRIVQQVVRHVQDGDFTRRELLAAKIFVGCHRVPAWGEVVPFAEDGATLAKVRFEQMRKSTTAEFATSITLRRAYAAPMFTGGKTIPTIFSDKRPTIWKIANCVLEALAASIDKGRSDRGSGEKNPQGAIGIVGKKAGGFDFLGSVLPDGEETIQMWWRLQLFVELLSIELLAFDAVTLSIQRSLVNREKMGTLDAAILDSARSRLIQLQDNANSDFALQMFSRAVVEIADFKRLRGGTKMIEDLGFRGVLDGLVDCWPGRSQYSMSIEEFGQFMSIPLLVRTDVPEDLLHDWRSDVFQVPVLFSRPKYHAMRKSSWVRLELLDSAKRVLWAFRGVDPNLNRTRKKFFDDVGVAGLGLLRVSKNPHRPSRNGLVEEFALPAWEFPPPGFFGQTRRYQGRLMERLALPVLQSLPQDSLRGVWPWSV